MGAGASVPSDKSAYKQMKKGFKKDLKGCKDKLTKLECKAIVRKQGIEWIPVYDIEFEFDAESDSMGVVRISKSEFIDIVREKLHHHVSGAHSHAQDAIMLAQKSLADQHAQAALAKAHAEEKAAAEKAAAEKAAAEKAAAEKAAAEKAAADKLAAEKAAAERRAAEKAAAERKAAEAKAAEASDSDDWGDSSEEEDTASKSSVDIANTAAPSKNMASAPSVAPQTTTEGDDSDSDWGSEEESNTDIKSKTNEMITMNRKAWSVVINEDQYKIYKAAFDSVDIDSDGCLERDEVEKFLRSAIGDRATDEYVKNWMTRVDDSKDNLIQIDEWIRAVIGKDYVITSNSLKLIKSEGGAAQKMPRDADKAPLCIGLVYKFVDGDHKNEVVYFKGMQSTSGYFVTKNVHKIDGLGEWGGSVIVVRLKDFDGKVKLTNEAEAWVIAQQHAIKLCRTYSKQQKKKVGKAVEVVERFNDFTKLSLSCKIEGKKFMTYNTKTGKEINMRTWKEKAERPY